MGYTRMLSSVQHPSHVSFFYESPRDRLNVLADYFRLGLKQNEACILVTRFPTEEVLQDFQSIGFDARPAAEEGTLQIFSDADIYVAGGKFDAEQMLTNVGSFIDQARDQGFSGVRTAGEMDWVLHHPHSAVDAVYYENLVNTLENAKYLTGMCLYPMNTTSKFMVGGALKTHPQFINDGRLYVNPYYQSAPHQTETLEDEVNTWVTHVTTPETSLPKTNYAKRAVQKILQTVS